MSYGRSWYIFSFSVRVFNMKLLDIIQTKIGKIMIKELYNTK